VSAGGPSGLGRGAAYGVAATGLEKAVALGIALYLSRHLGLGDYGRYAFVLGYMNFFQVVPDAALEAVLITRVVAEGADAAATAGRGVAVRLLVSLTGAALGLGTLWLATGDPVMERAAAVWAIGLVASALTPYRVLLRAGLDMRRYLVLLAAQGAVALVLLALAVRAAAGLPVTVGAVAGAAVAALGLGRLLVGGGVRLAFDATLARGLVAAAWPLAGTTLAVVGAQQALQLLLLHHHGPDEVALLGGPQKLVEAVGLLPQALMLSVLPALAAAGRAPASASARAGDVARLLVVVLLPVAATLEVWAEPVLTVGLGARFAPAAPVLRILALVTVLGATGLVLTNLLVATGLQRALFAVNVGTAVGMVILGAALVPAYGAAGAAGAFVGGLLAGQVTLLAMPATRPLVRPVLGAVVRPLGVGAVVVATAAALGGSPLAGALVLLVAYPLSLLASGAVTRADLSRWRAEGSVG
jgi:O-antigen/teichoic acid export membrane protein